VALLPPICIDLVPNLQDAAASTVFTYRRRAAVERDDILSIRILCNQPSGHGCRTLAASAGADGHREDSPSTRTGMLDYPWDLTAGIHVVDCNSQRDTGDEVETSDCMVRLGRGKQFDITSKPPVEGGG
jgi:hypothetical protein